MLTDEAEFVYKCDDFYNHSAEGGLKIDDPDVNIKWPLEKIDKTELIIAERDKNWPSLRELQNSDLFNNLNI